MPALTPLADAQAIVIQNARPSGAEAVPLALSVGRVLAADALARVDNPAFDNSAMDGFACYLADLTADLSLPLAGLSAAGMPPQSLTPGTAMEIMTGAALPRGADAIVPVEQATRQGDRVTFTALPAPGSFIRRRGSDLATGEIIAPAGTRIMRAHLLPLAAGGAATLTVRARPRIAVISTGAELVDDLAAPLLPGQIYNASAPFARQFLADAGATLVHGETLTRDTTDDLVAAFARARAAGADAIITTGAVSAGRFDLIPAALQAAGATILFHKLALRPGKPQLFARFADGTAVFGLPGNPSSTAVGLRFLVWPWLCACLGRPQPQPRLLPLAAAQTGHDSLMLLLKARLDDGLVQLLPGQESYRVAPLRAANLWAEIAIGAQLAAGALIPCHDPDPL